MSQIDGATPSFISKAYPTVIEKPPSSYWPSIVWRVSDFQTIQLDSAGNRNLSDHKTISHAVLVSDQRDATYEITYAGMVTIRKIARGKEDEDEWFACNSLAEKGYKDDLEVYSCDPVTRKNNVAYTSEVYGHQRLSMGSALLAKHNPDSGHFELTQLTGRKAWDAYDALQRHLGDQVKSAESAATTEAAEALCQLRTGRTGC